MMGGLDWSLRDRAWDGDHEGKHEVKDWYDNGNVDRVSLGN